MRIIRVLRELEDLGSWAPSHFKEQEDVVLPGLVPESSTMLACYGVSFEEFRDAGLGFTFNPLHTTHPGYQSF